MTPRWDLGFANVKNCNPAAQKSMYRRIARDAISAPALA